MWSLLCFNWVRGAASSLCGPSELDSRPRTGGVSPAAVAQPAPVDISSFRVSILPLMAYSLTLELEREWSPCWLAALSSVHPISI